MKKFLIVLSKIIVILVWIIFTDAGEKAEWYVIFYQYENTIHKCSRDKYNEYMELMNNPTEKQQAIYMHYKYNESVHYSEQHKIDN